MKRVFQHGAETLTLDIVRQGEDTLRVRLPEGTEHTVHARRLPGEVIEIVEGDRVFRIPGAYDAAGALWLAWAAEAARFTPAEDAAAASGPAVGPRSGVAVAPMVGIVADVTVAPGDRVTAYQSLVVVEAMKVFATVEAPFAGVVRRVHVRRGDRVDHGAPLVEVVPDATAEATP